MGNPLVMSATDVKGGSGHLNALYLPSLSCKLIFRLREEFKEDKELVTQG